MPPTPPARHWGWAWVFVGVAATLILVGSGVWSVVSVLGRQVRTVHRTYAPAATVEVHAAGSITVRRGTGERIVVTERIERSVSEPRRTSHRDGDRLELHSSCPSIVSSFCSVSYTIELPASTTLELRSVAGGIRVEGIDGPIEARSTAGRVVIVGGVAPLVLHSSAGGIAVQASRSQQVDASSSAGTVEIDLTRAPDRVEASSSAGGVDLALPPGETPYAVDASTSAGGRDVQVRTDPSSPHRIHVTSSAGDITVRYR
jgi:hypothetical protein